MKCNVTETDWRATDEEISDYRHQTAQRLIHGERFNDAGGNHILKSRKAASLLDKMAAGFVHAAPDTDYGRRAK